MNFIQILKTVLSIGAATVPTILNVVAPGMGTLVGTILTSVLTIEAKMGAGQGNAKAAAAAELLSVSAPAIVQLIELQTGKQLADEDLFAQGVSQMQEGAVKVLNAFRILPKPSA